MPERLGGLTFFFPAYDEEENVAAVVESALEVLPRFADAFDVVVVDDGSRDRTGEIADSLAAKHPEVRVIHHPKNRGYGGAVRSGLASARRPFVFYTDGDRQFDLNDLGRLVAALEDADAVVGYRLKRRDPFRRLVIAWVYNRLIRLLFGGGWRDVDCAFKLFRTEVFTRVPLELVRSNGAFFSPELLIVLRARGARVRQVGVPHYPRTLGEEKGATPRVVLRAIRDLLLLRWRLSRTQPKSGR
ncbi:MAG TPA: glycosyltransferase family 2 protein [Candidatus Limnocylindrales bacterium]|nr:glycosyltransferase family 2 protein [Candidatus Limnocylindrales bacterium]